LRFEAVSICCISCAPALVAKAGGARRRPPASEAGSPFATGDILHASCFRPLGRRGLAVSAFAIASPAQAANDYYLIRWDNTGACQVWNEGLTLPIKWPSNYKVMSQPISTLNDALTL
jgi:hypothetical protein